MKSLIKALTPKIVLRSIDKSRQRWFPKYARDSFSQEGEDLILERFLGGRETGFYVDIGAHHPMRYSNTYRLYLHGWRGLNIDATPGSMEMFKRVRPRDINIEAAVSATRKYPRFYVFNDPALNTFDRELALQRVGGIYSIVNEIEISTRPLSKLLDQHLPKNIIVDLLTVDVEGFDYEVLQSNDWRRYAPEYVLVECLETLTLSQANSDPIGKLLSDQQYSMVAKTMNTALFKRNL